MTSTNKITDFVSFNPKRSIKKGEAKPFVEMASLPVDSRDISEVSTRTYTGGGSRFQDGDTLFARITPCLENGKTAKASGLGDGVIAHGSTEFIVMSAKEPEYDEDFVYYLARMPEFRSYAQSRMEGTSGRQRVSWQSLAEFDFEFPEKEERKKIGGILKSLDDKIQINNRLNQTLEQIAQAIFKSWFVDFDPVKAKIAVLEAGGTAELAELAAMSVISAKDEDALKKLQAEQPEAYAELAQTAALFPSKMVDSELGEIPEGWEIFALSALVNLTGGGTPKRSEPSFWGGEIPWFSVRDVPVNGNIFVIDTEEKITELGLKKSSTRLLPQGTTIITARGTVGKLALLAKDMCMNQSCYGVRGKEHGPYFNYFYLSEAVATLKQNTHGAVFDTITTSTFDTYRSSFCGKEISSRFEATITPLMEAIKNNLQENDSLSKSRDALLPKLLSGELIGE